MNKISHLVLTFVLLTLSSPPVSAETILARVGSRVITLEELKVTLNSTPNIDPDAKFERDGNNPVFRLLVNVIDSEILYLEANKSGVRNLPEFKREINSYTDSILADEYKNSLLAKMLIISDRELNSLMKEKDLTKNAAEALIRKEKKRELLNNESFRLFDKYGVKFSSGFTKKEIKGFRDNELLVTANGFEITYSEIRKGFDNFGSTKNDLLDYLTQIIEINLFSLEAKKDRLDKSVAFREIADEFARSLTINIYRQNYLRKAMPSKRDVDAFLKNNKYLANYPQNIAALLIVCKTEEEANSVREKALEGESFYNLAIQHSIAPNAKINAGDIGPIKIGDKPLNQVDRELLKLEIGEISPPLKGYQGYSIFKMLEKAALQERPIKERERIARQAILEGRLFSHLEELRKKVKVEIYDPPSGSKS